jgi:hypothetical protein
MEATPFEQVVEVAVATKGTGEPTVAPLLGLVTVTLARADVANAKKTRRMQKKAFIMVGTSESVERAHLWITSSDLPN